jgi:4-hydroxythreonine-4-phosphate dehydrogenase
MVVRIAVTAGDPCGIGPEVAARALAAGLPAGFEPVWIGPESLLEKLSRRFRTRAGLLPCGEAPRRPGAASGRAALQALDRAIGLLRNGTAHALVTAPLSKACIVRAGIPFPGHTEYLAAAAGTRDVTMAFVADRFVTSLVTTHLPLRRVPEALAKKKIIWTIRRTHDFLAGPLGVRRPHIAVAGLNPHAGEEGLFGDEEGRLIAPAIRDARRAGIDCEGPFAPDSVFRRRGFDAVVSMYHDHGLTGIKTLHPGAVHVTLGLPWPRTSPDHGVAFDLAGRGRADARPMRAALLLACRLTRRPGSSTTAAPKRAAPPA